jgi:cytochrome c551/c552
MSFRAGIRFTPVVARIVVMLAVLGAVAMLVSCDRRGDPNASSASTQPPPATAIEDSVRAGGVAPPAGELRNPHAGDANSAKAGEGLFASMNCDGCHGGGGSGWVGPSLADGRWRYGGSDAEIFQSIFYGRPKGMPAYGGAIGRDGVWMLVNYLKSLPKPDVVPTQSWIESTSAVPRPDRNEETSSTANSTNGAAAATRSEQPAAANVDGEKLAQLSGCTACHSVERKIVGPAFRDVAAKYRGQQDAEQKLFHSARNGSSGVWGPVPMPPNSAVKDEDLRKIVTWILGAS